MTTVDWGALGGDLLDDVLSAEDAGPDFGDRYEVKDVLGQGGQGTVYLAWDRSLEREVAIKCLRDPGMNQRPLLEESRLLSRLAHPAIPQVYDRGRSPNGGSFVVIQYIGGDRLDQALRRRELELADRLHLFRGVAGAVAHAHARGILHRDLKPENVMVTEAGEPYLVDWGLAANGGPRAICGSPYFAAPEQLDGQPADPRADIYALGVLLYFILSGELPYGRSVRSFDEFRRQRAALTRVPLRRRVPGVLPALERMSETAMAAQPGARYQRVDELLADLSHVESGRPLARDLPRLPWRGLAAAAVASIALAGGVLIGRVTAGADPASPAATPSPVAGTERPRGDAFDDLWSAPRPAEPVLQDAAVEPGTAVPDHEPGDVEPDGPVAEAVAEGDGVDSEVDASVSSPETTPEESATNGAHAPDPPLSDPLTELEALLPTIGDDAPSDEPDWEELLPPVAEPAQGGPGPGGE